MRSFLPYVVFIWLLGLFLSFAAPANGVKLPQPMWAITLFGSFVLVILSLRSKEKWLS